MKIEFVFLLSWEIKGLGDFDGIIYFGSTIFITIYVRLILVCIIQIPTIYMIDVFVIGFVLHYLYDNELKKRTL